MTTVEAAIWSTSSDLMRRKRELTRAGVHVHAASLDDVLTPIVGMEAIELFCRRPYPHASGIATQPFPADTRSVR
jgi:hypothetical protein